MSEPIYLDRRGTTIVGGVFLTLLALVFVAGWICGVLIGLPGFGPSVVVSPPTAALPPEIEPKTVTVRIVPPVEEQPAEEIAPPEEEKVAAVTEAPQTTEAAEPAEVVAETAETEAAEAGEATGQPEAGEDGLHRYTVQVGSFRNRDNAEDLARSLAAKGYDAAVKAATLADGREWFAVRLGFSDTLQAARQAADRYVQQEGGSILIIRLRPPEADSGA